MRSLLLLLSALFALSLSARAGHLRQSASASARGSNDSTLLAKADTLRAHDKCKDANKIYNDLIERHSFEVKALIGRAACIGDANKALADLARALELSPNDPHAHATRAMVYRAMNMFDRAILDLDLAIAHSPDTVFLLEAMNSQAWCRLNVRDLQGALDQVNAILTLDTADSHAVNTKAVVLEEMGRIDEALAELEHFIRLDPEADEGYLNTAFFLSKHDRHQEALAYYDKMEPRVEKDDAYFFNNRGYTRMKLGDTKGALKDIQRSIDLRPGNSYAYRNLGLTFQAMGKKDDACDAFEKALALGFTGQFGDEVEKEHATYCR